MLPTCTNQRTFSKWCTHLHAVRVLKVLLKVASFFTKAKTVNKLRKVEDKSCDEIWEIASLVKFRI